INIEHQSADSAQHYPLERGARVARFIPVPQEKGHNKSRERMRPRRIEIHVNGERAGPPDGKSSEQRPAFVNVFAGDAKGNEQAEKTVEGGGERHRDPIRRGKTVGGNCGAHGTREENGGGREAEKGGPENSRSHGEVILQMAGGGAGFRSGLAVFVETIFAEAGVGLLIVSGEIEIVLDEGGAGESV